jgi:hypothetical protein
MTDLSGMGKEFPAIHLKNSVQSLDLVFHIHGNVLLRHGFRKGKVLFHQQSKQFHFIFIQVVFCHAGIGFSDG